MSMKQFVTSEVLQAHRLIMRAQAIPTVAATIHAANTRPFAFLQRSARSFSHATDPAESPSRTTVAARLVGTIFFCPVPPPATSCCCFFSSLRAIHFSRSRGSIPKSPTLYCSRNGDTYDTQVHDKKEGEIAPGGILLHIKMNNSTLHLLHSSQFAPLDWHEHTGTRTTLCSIHDTITANCRSLLGGSGSTPNTASAGRGIDRIQTRMHCTWSTIWPVFLRMYIQLYLWIMYHTALHAAVGREIAPTLQKLRSHANVRNTDGTPTSLIVSIYTSTYYTARNVCAFSTWNPPPDTPLVTLGGSVHVSFSIFFVYSRCTYTLNLLVAIFVVPGISQVRQQSVVVERISMRRNVSQESIVCRRVFE